jgi:hypothetical protein
MKITTARNWYGEGSGIVIKTDDYLIDMYFSTRFKVGVHYTPRYFYEDSSGQSFILELGWLRCEITEDHVNYWEHM